MLKVTWADEVWGKSYGLRRGFHAQAKLPGGPRRPLEARKQPKTHHTKTQEIRFSECQWAAQYGPGGKSEGQLGAMWLAGEVGGP